MALDLRTGPSLFHLFRYHAKKLLPPFLSGFLYTLTYPVSTTVTMLHLFILYELGEILYD